jgi:Domain of unknown function (DUF4838)/Carbohydrate family 9 binding domain-like
MFEAIAVCCGGTTMLQGGNPLDNPALNKIRKHNVAVHAPLLLVEKGRVESVVVIPAPPAKTKNAAEYKALVKIQKLTKKAAKEFIKYVKAVTGAQLPLQTDAKALPPGKNLILIGESSLTKARGINAKDLPLEGFRIQTFSNGVAIVGRMPDERENYNLRGGYYVPKESAAQSVLFGVYDFLERFCGVRWYYPGKLGNFIPAKKDLSLPACNYTDWPEFSKRTGAHWMFFNPSKTTSNYAGAQKNGPLFRMGDSSYVDFGCHSPDGFGVHREKNPECFELSSSGHRDSHFPCYGNPKTVDLMFNDLLRFYEKGDVEPFRARRSGKPWCVPTAGRILVSPPDKAIACNCDYCKKLWRNDLGYNRQASDILVQFTQKLAEKVEKKWPEKKVLLLPYLNYLTCPANAKFPKNVIAFICLTYGTANQKEAYVEKYNSRTIADWVKATSNKVIIWEYLCWPAENTFLPFQYPNLIKEFYLKNRGKILGATIDGHVSQGVRRASTDMTPGGEWAYSHPTIYCWYRLMWNPEFDVQAALDEYCNLMYGPAAPEMKKILTLLTSRWEKTKWKELIQDHNIKSSQVHDETMPKTEVKKLAELLKKAEQLAGKNNIFRKRLDFFGTAIKKFIEASKQYHSNNKPEMQIKRVGDNPVIDGDLNDRCWRQSEKYYLKSAYSTRKSKHPPVTKCRAVWTKDGVTFGIVNYESFEIVAKCTKHDGRVYSDDSIELFLQCGRNPTYFHIIVNSLGAYYDEFGNDNSFNFKGIKVASIVNKKLHYWSCEIFIPFNEMGITPKPNIEFTGNIARNRRYRYRNNVKKKFYRWHTTYRASHNDTAAFGKMKLVE